MHDGRQCSGTTRITVRQRVCCQGVERLHTGATQATQPGCRLIQARQRGARGRVGRAGKHLRSRCDSLGLQPRQATTSRGRADEHKDVCCARGWRDRRWMAGQKQQQCAVRLKYGRRGVEHSHEQGSGGRRGALTPGEGAKRIDRVSR